MKINLLSIAKSKAKKRVLFSVIIVSFIFLTVTGLFKVVRNKNSQIFLVERDGSKKYIRADLKNKGRYADIWVDESERMPLKKLQFIRRSYEKIYPVNRKYFGYSDTKSKKTDIFITNTGSVDGYFDPDISPDLIYLNSKIVTSEPSEAYNTLAHESAHLFYYQTGGPDNIWLDEGIAVYAEYLNRISIAKQNKSNFQNGYYGDAFKFIDFASEQVNSSGNPLPLFFKSLIKNGDKRGIDAVLQKYVENTRYNSKAEIDNILKKPENLDNDIKTKILG